MNYMKPQSAQKYVPPTQKKKRTSPGRPKTKVNTVLANELLGLQVLKLGTLLQSKQVMLIPDQNFSKIWLSREMKRLGWDYVTFRNGKDMMVIRLK